ncbi:Ureidoglycolate lyase [bioreactor metagenome]|uniref:Ureidoglycolate lyase n=1 Tax=bioreactor metagenome TaxID=1076179 RepID=A0A644ZBF6_9ZZZZ
MKIKAEFMTFDNFSTYGSFFDMLEDKMYVKHFQNEVYNDHMTDTPLIDTNGHLGYTYGSAAPYICTVMEKHDHTQEAIFCAGEPIILCVAKSANDELPLSENIRAFILQPGQVAVINRNIWHDACRGLHKRCNYYYLATAGRMPAEWKNVAGIASIEIDN